MAGADCERLRSGWLAQPANAVSSLAYLAFGCSLILGARRGRGHPEVLLSGGLAMIAVGIGSMAYHGPQPGWADFVHGSSILGLVVVVVLHSIRFLVGGGTRRVVLTAWRSAGAWLALGLAAYVLGRSGSRWCRSASLWQWHAGWHVLSAVALFRGLFRMGDDTRGGVLPVDLT